MSKLLRHGFLEIDSHHSSRWSFYR